jgi:glutamate/tyrosine decarboxylase-like PLP-dependent enzyme
VHADAAYGGYFKLVNNLRPETKDAFDGLNAVDSIVIDPHKQPAAVWLRVHLFRDPEVGRTTA